MKSGHCRNTGNSSSSAKADRSHLKHTAPADTDATAVRNLQGRCIHDNTGNPLLIVISQPESHLAADGALLFARHGTENRHLEQGK